MVNDDNNNKYDESPDNELLVKAYDDIVVDRIRNKEK